MSRCSICANGFACGGSLEPCPILKLVNVGAGAATGASRAGSLTFGLPVADRTIGTTPSEKDKINQLACQKRRTSSDISLDPKP